MAMDKIDLNSDIDLVDQNPRYMEICEKEAEPNSWFTTHRKTFIYETDCLNKSLDIIGYKGGTVIEAGVYKAFLFDQLCERYGSENCYGFDIYPYVQRPNLIIGDFRQLPSKYNFKTEIFFNSFGPWTTLGSSKRAGLDYAKKNLITGGFYFDFKIFESTMPNMKAEGFRKVPKAWALDSVFAVYQKC
jgi:hypothetical protein